MNREIKFRAWNKDGRHMIDLHKVTPLALDANLNQDGVFIPFNPSLVVMQLTGLKDKNGVEIYEGDIVKPVETRGMRWKRAVIEYQRAEFVMVPEGESHSFKTLTEIGWKRLEVIGNIYENPELLVS